MIDLELRQAPWALPALVLFISLSACALSGPAKLYVSPDGKDSFSGRRPTAEGNDGPFATLERARQEVRSIKAAGLPADGIIVELRGGTYRMTGTFELSAEDSGTEASPVIWQAAPGEDVRLIGGVRLTELEAVTDPAVRERLAPEARDAVRQADLGALGVASLGEVDPATGRRAELFCNNRYMPLARYPNDGWLLIAEVPQEGDLKNKGRYDDGQPVLRNGIPHGKHYGRFRYDGDRPDRWADTRDVWMHGYWVYDWRDEYQQVERIDPETNEVWPRPPYHGYGYHAGQRYYFLNILEELDQPGEWYLDRQSGTIYLWPPEPVDEAEIIFPDLEEPMIRLAETQHVAVRGLTFEGSRAGAVAIAGGSDNEIVGCTIRNVGDSAISINGGLRNGVRDCDLYELAGGGISLSGGNRKTLERSDHYAVNCHIHHFGRVFKTYRPGISLDGVGQRVSHSYLHDCPHAAIGYTGNDHTVEYSEFERVALETGDVGCIYTAMDWTYMGHVFRYNYFHNIHGPGALGSMTIYLDMPCGGAHVYGNVFRDMDRAFFTNSGRDCLIENNIFIDCHPSVQFNRYWLEKEYQPGGDWRMVERLDEVDHDQPPYSTRYPGLLRLFNDGDPSIPTGNIVRRNISMGAQFLELHPMVDLEDVEVEDNLIADPVVFVGSFDGSGQGKRYENGDPEVAEELGKYGNVIVEGNPGLVDVEAEDYWLKPDSPARRLGFEPIPFEQIGLEVTEDRRALPAWAPSIEPASRLFIGELEVRLVAALRSAGAVLRYTLDGSEPTVESPRYTDPIRLTDTTTVRAAAFASPDASEHSETIEATYAAGRLGPDGGVHLSDLPAQDVLAHAGLKRDTNYNGSGPIRVGGRAFAKGLMLHPEAAEEGGLGHATFILDGGLSRAERLTAIIGIEDSEGTSGSATFAVEVLRDGEWHRVFESDVLRGGQSQGIDVDVAGAQEIRLVTTDAGDNINGDSAVWADAKLQ